MNWFLFYRGAEFAEVLTVESTVFRRTGRVHTWGKSERIECANQEAAFLAAAHARKEFVRDGFELKREWRFEPDAFDFELLARELLFATRSVFTRMSATHVGLNAFSLCTDVNAMTILAVAHLFPSIAEASDDVLWNPGDWKLEDRGAELDIAYRLILSQHRDPATRFDPAEYRQGFKRTVIAVLSELKSEGFFGAEEFVLLFVVFDSGDDEQALIEELNGEALGARYAAALAKWK